MAGYIGQQFGNYRLLRLIGHGGFADVYLGEHIYMGTQAAIKVLHAHLGTQEIERFRQEASMVARLEHPHIVRVLEFGVEETIPYLVLNYAPNGTLRSRHPKGSALPIPTIVTYIRQIADALQYAHNAKIVHRDIKPENMLIGKRDEILLSDFGIALISQNSRSEDMKDLAGTAAYMAPEQIEGHPRAASDQYALAIVAYEWLCGFCPFHGTFTETAMQHAVTPPPPLHEKMPGISPMLEQVVLTALAKDPSDRFASIQGFARAFEQASQTSISSQTPPRVATSIGSSELPTVMATHTPVFLPSDAKSPTNPPVAPTVVSAPGDTPLPVEPTVVAPTVVTPTVVPASVVLPLPATMKSDSQTPVNLATSMMDVQSKETVTPPSQSATPLDVPPRLRRTLKVRDALLILLALVIVGGGVWGGVYFFSRPHNTQSGQTPQALQTAIVTMQKQHQQAVSAYKRYTDNNGGMFGFSAQHTHFNPYEAILSPAHITAIQAWVAHTGGVIGISSAVVSDGVVYVGSRNDKLYAFDAISGRQKWVATTNGHIDSTPAVANGIVYVGSEDHDVYAFDARTGQKKWTLATKGPITSSPMLAYGVLYIGSEDGKLYAINENNGTLEWAKSADESGIYSSPAWSDGEVYAASLSGNVYAFDAKTGKQMWKFPTGAKIYSSPAVVKGIVYVGSYNHKIYALTEKTGKVAWAQLITGAIFASPAIAYGLVYVTTNAGSLYAFNALSGAVEWVNLYLYASDSSPFVANGLVYLGTKANSVVAFNAQTGQKKGSFATKASVDASPIVANGVIYFGAADGSFYAFHLA